MVKIENSLNKDAEIYAKLEGANPSGSVKDRIALAMIEHAEKEGKLVKGKAIIEASSGNTGIALAMIGAVKGYAVKVVIPENTSKEKIGLLRAYGAKVVLTPKEQEIDGAVKKATKIVKSNPRRYFSTDQYSNEYNPIAHYMTTAREILEQMNYKIDYFVAGIGTGGTISGIGKALKEALPSVRVVGIQPEKNHGIQGLKNLEESAVPKVYAKKFVDELITVKDKDAFRMARELALRQGLVVGISSGAAMHGALEISRRIKSGRIVIVFPDRGDRYVSMDLFGR